MSYLESYLHISEASRVNLLNEKLSNEDQSLSDMMRATSTLEKVG